MNKTKIEWVQNPDGSLGYSWNPITGCLNGCDYCYAWKLANSRLKSSYLANRNVSSVKDGINDLAYSLRYATPFYPRFWPGKVEPLDKNNPYSRVKPIGVFVCNMGDLFGISVPEEWTRKVLEHIAWSTQHRFYLLTKQPQNLIKFSPFPDNCWVGVTVTKTEILWPTMVALQCIKAKLKFISFEPLLYWNWFYNEGLDVVLKSENIGWLIIGAQTKPYKPPKIEWVEEIVRAADKAGVPVFLKNNLYQAINSKIWDRVPVCMIKQGVSELILRQEMPNT